MDLSRIKNVFFDLGVVLIDLDKKRCVEEFRRLGVSDIETQIGQSFKSGLFFSLEEGSVTPAQFRDEIRRMSGIFIADADIDHAWNLFLREICPEKFELLKRLRRNHRVYMLSNTNQIHFDYMRIHTFKKENGCSLEDCFDKCYLSHELHLSKPDPKIFEYVLSDSGASANESLFIDDNEQNVAAAKVLGFKTCHYRSLSDLESLFGAF